MAVDVASEHLYSGVCVMCREEVRAKLKLERGEPYPMISAICPCREPKPGVVLMVRPAGSP